ncbi:MAG: TonB-dependent receptor [Bacteroidetes bacterium]|nr:TonB-dependent receptor [Bacteroidota bacterium]
MIKHFTLVLFAVLSLSVFAQNREITGKVTGPDGSTIPGVTIQLTGTTKGTTTDVNGLFRIDADKGGLKFSCVGYITQEIKLKDQTIINVALQENVSTLNEIVVIGYGAQVKKDLTTAVSVVDQKDIEDRPIVTAAQALQGKAAGVQVVQPSGKPGANISVHVRGTTSVLAGNEPLYVVDGVPTTDIRGLNPSDIASMSVLKDASSAAIYGARAANGVVTISTFRGKENTPTIKFNTYFGMSWLRKPIEVLNTKQYRALIDEMDSGTYNPAWTGYTDWSKETFGTGYNQSYQLSASGGSEKTQYFASIGVLSEAGIVKPAQFDRYSFRLNLDNELRYWLKIGTSLNMIYSKTKDTPDNASSGRGGVIMSALNTPPFLSVYKNDGSGQFDPNPFQNSWENPIAYMQGPDQKSVDFRVFGNVNATATFLKDFSFTTNFGIDFLNHQWDYYLDPFRTSDGRVKNGVGRSDKYNNLTWLWENTLNYTKSFGKNKIAALVGASIQRYNHNQTYLEGNDFPSDVSVTTLNAANKVYGWTNVEEWALASFFGRVTYDYNSKYYLTVSLRRDGSSKLANPWGTMPAFSAAWRISAESFMKKITVINDLKLRGGWGKNGNQEGIPNYARYGLTNYYPRASTDPLSGPSAVQVTYGNPDLKWETTSQTNIGLDLSMFNSRITFNVDVYYKITHDVILPVQLPASSPITNIMTNAGTIENKGIEFNLNTVNIAKKLRWDTDFNLSFNRNMVKELTYPGPYAFGWIYSNNQNVSIVQVGMPLGTFYGYVSEGVDPETGMIKYADLNNNGRLDAGDRTVIGHGQPLYTFGFTNTFKYWRFDLSIFFQGSVGNDIYNATRIDLEGMFDSKNQSVSVLNRWTPDNRYTDIPRVMGKNNTENVRNSTRFVEDGSYVRLKSITLSYKIIENPKKLKGVPKLSVFVTGQNLLTFTKYTGFDPEVNAYGNSATEMGIDYGTYPQALTLIAGFNVEF